MKTKGFNIEMLLLLIWAVLVQMLNAQEPLVRTDRLVYEPKNEIVIEYSGLPGNQTDWISITEASDPDGTYGGQWLYTKGNRNGIMKFLAGSPGNYEVRVYFNYPQGGKTVQARFAFRVESGIRSIALNTQPSKAPAPSSTPPRTSTPPSQLNQQPKVQTQEPQLSVLAERERAQKLADAITKATTNDERYQVLLEIMKALNMGVYTGNGEALLRGAERGPSDVYLYDFELWAISDALNRKATWTERDIEWELNNILVKAGLPVLSEGKFYHNLHYASQESIYEPTNKPANPLSFPHLLIRELGLRQTPPYDLAKSQYGVPWKFDALQRFLIISDVLVPLVRRAAQLRVSIIPNTLIRPVAFRSNQSVRFVAGDDPCSFIGNDDLNEFKYGKLLISLIPLPVLTEQGLTIVGGKLVVGEVTTLSLGNIALLAAIGLDAWHGELLGLFMDLQETQAGRKTEKASHLGPIERGHLGSRAPPGQKMMFQIGVQMLADLSKYPILQCGKLAGLTFPPKGPVKGVIIHWDRKMVGIEGLSDFGLLAKYGNLRYNEETDEKGIATLIFEPTNESDKTKDIRHWITGFIHHTNGTLIPSADIASSFGNILARVDNIVMPKAVRIPFTIESHEPAEWEDPCKGHP